MGKEIGMWLDLPLPVEPICEFISFSQWANKASSWIGGFPDDEQIICIASNGKVLTCGKDFMYARENDLFPVKAYRLIRVTE